MNVDGKPMVRLSNGDWIGTFEGHQGAVWCARPNRGLSAAQLLVTASADMSMYVRSTLHSTNMKENNFK